MWLPISFEDFIVKQVVDLLVYEACTNFSLEKHLTAYVAMYVQYKDNLSMEYLSENLILGNFSKEQNLFSLSSYLSQAWPY